MSSKRKVRVMMELFEKYIDESIFLIDIENSCIQTKTTLYKVDISKNTIEKRNYDKYTFSSYDYCD